MTSVRWTPSPRPSAIRRDIVKRARARLSSRPCSLRWNEAYGFFAAGAAAAGAAAAGAAAAGAAAESFLVVSTTAAAAGAAAALSTAGAASSFLAQAERTSTAATRAKRFIEIISRWGTRKAQRETAPWYAVLDGAEVTNTKHIVKTCGMHLRGERMPMRNERIVSASGRANSWSRHALTQPEVQHLKIRSNYLARN